MAHTSPRLGYWGDGHFFTNTRANEITPFYNDVLGRGFRKMEALVDRGTMHHVSVRIRYTNAQRSSPVFTNLSLYTSAFKGQPLYSHEATMDRGTMNAISLRIRHTGSEFIISHAQLLVQMEKQRPRG